MTEDDLQTIERAAERGLVGALDAVPHLTAEVRRLGKIVDELRFHLGSECDPSGHVKRALRALGVEP